MYMNLIMLWHLVKACSCQVQLNQIGRPCEGLLENANRRRLRIRASTKLTVESESCSPASQLQHNRNPYLVKRWHLYFLCRRLSARVSVLELLFYLTYFVRRMRLLLILYEYLCYYGSRFPKNLACTQATRLHRPLRDTTIGLSSRIFSAFFCLV